MVIENQTDENELYFHETNGGQVEKGIKVITVFGPSRVRPGDAIYSAVKRLGLLLRNKGVDVKHGGHDGVMEALSEGLQDSSSKSIGITLDALGKPPSRHLTKEIKAEDIFQRVKLMVTGSDAYIVFKGNLGTMSEFFITWMIQQNALIDKKPPIFLYGEDWKAFIATLAEFCGLTPNDLRHVSVIEDIEELNLRLFAIPNKF